MGGEGSALIIERNMLQNEERREEAGFQGDPGAERPGGEGGGGQGGAGATISECHFSQHGGTARTMPGNRPRDVLHRVTDIQVWSITINCYPVAIFFIILARCMYHRRHHSHNNNNNMGIAPWSQKVGNKKALLLLLLLLKCKGYYGREYFGTPPTET